MKRVFLQSHAVYTKLRSLDYIIFTFWTDVFINIEYIFFNYRTILFVFEKHYRSVDTPLS